MHHQLKAVFCLLMLFPLTCLGDAKEKEPPAGKDELEAWLVGTEWVSKEIEKGSWIYVVRRFYPNGVMQIQLKVRKWTAGTPIQKTSYKVMEANAMEYGGLKWSAVFNEDFSEYRANSNKRKTRAVGTYLGTFQVE